MARGFQRSHKQRSVGKKVIISCEGKTEYGYFEEIRIAQKLSTLRVIQVNHAASDPLNVVLKAIERREQERNKKSWESDDQAWAVFDGDEHIANNAENWHQAIQKADREKIHLAISNPCFEFWYLLHFQDQFAYLHRDEARRSLKKYLPDYEKANRLYPNPLASSMEQAIERAKLVTNRSEKLYENPYTSVHELVALLLSLK